jgi:beta-glucosidase
MATEPYRDATLPVEGRVADLLARMTPEEKLAQLTSRWAHELLVREVFDETRAVSLIGQGIGHITRVSGATNLDRRGAAALANRIQRFLVEKSRLGIPAIVHEECLHGLLARESVCFPQSIGVAASWDPEIVAAMAGQLGRELRAIGAQQALAPIFDVTRDPRWGRVEETYGEDPYLVAELAAAYTRGLQGDGGPQDLVLATGKHLVGHGVPEGGLNHAPSHIGSRELQDVFLFPFEAGIRGAGLRSIMHAYDDVDGVPCVASRQLLTDLLRERWGFDGTVVSDYVGIDELVGSHAVTADEAEAAALALEAGVDVELPSTRFYAAPLAQAMASGRVTQATVDSAVARVLQAKFELGLFERPYVDPEATSLPYEADRALARELARRSMVLLTNDGTLPLAREIRSVAVIGPNADSARNLLGDYAHQAHIEALTRGGLGLSLSAPEWLAVVDETAGLRTILDAVRDRVGAGTEIRYAPGCGILDGSDEGIRVAANAARGADVALVVVGERSGLTSDCTCGEARDRLDIGLPGRQSELVAAVAATGTPVVLVLVSGRPLAIEAEAALSAAVIHAWVPGEEGPEALVDILFGVANPGGKLPITVPRHSGQIPVYYGHKPSGGRSQWHGAYVDGSNEPLWPFGFGLSYTQFEVSDLRLDRGQAPVDGEFTASVEVRNVGERAGDEVVGLYIRDVEACVTRPVLQLYGFKRVTLQPGQARRVSFRVGVEQLAFTGVDGRLCIEPGRVVVMAGSSSQDLPCKADLEIVGRPVTLERRTRYFTEVSVE